MLAQLFQPPASDAVVDAVLVVMEVVVVVSVVEDPVVPVVVVSVVEDPVVAVEEIVDLVLDDVDAVLVVDLHTHV